MTDHAEELTDRTAAFAADLRRLREEAGRPSLRTMSATAHYSHTALSGVLRGDRLPSLELTLAFVRACGGSEQDWRARWLAAAAVQAPVVEAAAVQAPVVEAAAVLVPAVELVAGPPAGPRQRRHPLQVLMVAAVLVVAGAGLTAAIRAAPSRPVAAAGPAQLGPAAAQAQLVSAVPSVTAVPPDGDDPKEHGCQVDAVNVTTVPVTGPGGAGYGYLTFRFSRRCRAAWPLFVTVADTPVGVTVHLESRRAADGATAGFDYLYSAPTPTVYGNVLQTTQGCVSVAIDLRAVAGDRSVARAATPCLNVG